MQPTDCNDGLPRVPRTGSLADGEAVGIGTAQELIRKWRAVVRDAGDTREPADPATNAIVTATNHVEQGSPDLLIRVAKGVLP